MKNEGWGLYEGSMGWGGRGMSTEGWILFPSLSIDPLSADIKRAFAIPTNELMMLCLSTRSQGTADPTLRYSVQINHPPHQGFIFLLGVLSRKRTRSPNLFFFILTHLTEERSKLQKPSLYGFHLAPTSPAVLHHTALSGCLASL